MAALPLLDVDWELVSDQEFRELLAALNFEATYDPSKRELTIRVTLVPELTHPDGPRAPLLFVPPAGFVSEGNAHDLGFRAVSWLSRDVLSSEVAVGALVRMSGGSVIEDPELPSLLLAQGDRQTSDLSNFYLRRVGNTSAGGNSGSGGLMIRWSLSH